MIDVGPRPATRAAVPVDPHAHLVRPAVGAGLLVTGAAAALLVLLPGDGALLAIGLLAGAPVLAAAVALLVRRPELAPWGAVLLFATSAELRLRVHPTVGLLKDAYVALLLAIVVLYVWQRPSALRRLRPLALPLAALGVLVGMYLLDPAGGHGTSWLFGTRLLVQVLALLLIGALLAPRATLPHLVRAMCVILPFEAVLGWVQQAVGRFALVYDWGYEYGAQVRTTSGGGLRTSGTFEDPFQLAALAVLGLALALFVATRRQAAVLVVSATAVLAATSVRTAMLQAVLLLAVYAVRRGFGREAAALGAVAAVAGVLFLATTTSAVRPGAPEEPLLLTLNGRSDAWALAVDGWESLVTGNGVGARGTGSTRTDPSVSDPPSYDGTAPDAAFAGNPAFLDSSYAQVQSDVGIVGIAALLSALAATAVFLVRRCRGPDDGVAWAACGVLVVSIVDWVGRSSLASYTTGFLTLYVLGVLLGAVRHQEQPR
jgi:hypothetical protein